MQPTKIVRVPLRVANSYLVIAEKTVIVDTGDPGYSQRILTAIRRNGLQKKDISLIFITHGHVDHFGSAYALKQVIDAPIVMQKLDAPYFVDGIQAPLYPKNKVAALMKRRGKDLRVEQRNGYVADIIFEEEMDLKPYGVEGRLLATPGHTLGSASLILPDGRAVIGDLLVRKYFLVGQPLPPAFLHDTALFKASMKKLKEERIHTFYPGHGKLIQQKELKIG